VVLSGYSGFFHYEVDLKDNVIIQIIDFFQYMNPKMGYTGIVLFHIKSLITGM
jgi:hypothetical protein